MPISAADESPQSPPAPAQAGRNDLAFWIFVVLLAAGMFFSNLGLLKLTDVNEGQRLLPALEMIERGDWVVPRIEGQPYVTKPPLVYWIIAGSYKIAGKPSPLAGRVPTALCGLLAALAITLIGQRHQSGRAGFWAGLMLPTAVYFRQKFQITELDPFLTLALLIGVYSFWRALTADLRRASWTLLSALAFGCGFMLKGPVIFPFLLAAILAVWIVARPPWGRLGAVSGVILIGVGVIASPWVLLLLQRLGARRVWDILYAESLVRVVKSTKINSGPIYFYLVQISQSFLPWTWLLLFWPARPFKVYRRERADRFYPFAAWFTGGSIVIFSLIKGKETEYLLPAFPFLALLAGLTLDWLVQPAQALSPHWRRARWVFVSLAAAGCLTPAVFLIPHSADGRLGADAATFIHSMAANLVSSKAILAMLALGSLTALGCLVALLKNLRVAGVAGFILAFALLSAAFGDARKIEINESKCVEPLARRIQELGRQGLWVYRWHGRLDRVWPQDVWYFRDVSRPMPEGPELERALAEHRHHVAILSNKKDIKRLTETIGARIKISPEFLVSGPDYGLIGIEEK